MPNHFKRVALLNPPPPPPNACAAKNALPKHIIRLFGQRRAIRAKNVRPSPSPLPPPPTEMVQYTYTQLHQYRNHRRTGPFPFGGGGGAQQFLPEFLIFARKVEYVWAMHFCLTWGGGGKESSYFGVIEYGTPHRGRVWEGVSPHGGDFLEIGVLKTRFWVR